MSSVYRQPNRNDTLIGSIAVSFVRYMQRTFFYGDEYEASPEALRLRAEVKIETFPNKVFRQHVENMEGLIAPSMQRYAEELFDYLTEEMLKAGHLKEEGDGLYGTIPLNEHQRKRWLKAKLDQWKASLL